MPSVFHNLIACSSRKRRRRQQHHKKKKKKIQQQQQQENEEEEGRFELKPSSSTVTHAIQPLGNLLLLGPSCANIRDRGLGSLRVLPDHLLLDLLSLLRPRDLSALSAASRAFFVFSTHDPLWRDLVLRHLRGDFLFRGSWRSTYVSALSALPPPPPRTPLRITGFYSDYLFQSCLCATLQMKPDWLATDNIQRRRAISVHDFVCCFEEPNQPVLLQGCIDAWPAMTSWDRPNLLRLCGDAKFSVGPIEMTLENYFRYADAAKEERPLYLFDPKFADKVPQLGLDYEVPAYFREDLFGLLGSERPDCRWIIIGPAGSGSSFHVDPNSTSAWNAVIRGSKKWVMFPPEVVPPGVHPSPDGAEVACPVSIIEWFMNFYGACRNWKRRPVECVCRAGEVVFVPNGWWHLVVNLEDSIAITQNYASRRNLLNVLDFLKKPNANELVSGTKDRVNLYEKFRSAIEVAFPGTIDQLTLEAQEKMTQQKKLTFWESVTDANAGGFKFSF